ncbi:putative gnat family protein [Eutypa lata UCREL1]|uniref:Putative gnat family protein n=1 Tax=Eutypa lata (strain UCR-EL1) TaxID=1287681 RepID=M7T4A7_EUTLA|nr:putative gnat family protein [Eutypa lata UCREL1]
MPVEVITYKEPPPQLFALLKRHVPHSLPLLRRLEFTRFPGGITEQTHILWASDVELANDLPASSVGFTAGYLDFSRGPETELWLYSSLERDHHALPDKTAAAAAAAESACGDLAVAALREVRRIRDRYPDEERRKLPTLLIGGLNNELRCAMANRGVVFPYVTPWDKWMFRVDELPDIDVSGVAGGALPPGMRWDAVRREEIPLVLSRSNIERTERTVKLLRTVAIKLEDGTPIAWAFLGPDSSLSSLHVEPQYRGKGLAKAVAVKILREHLKDYGDEGYGWADVAPDNLSSQGVCKSLGGKIAWTINWSKADLDKSFPDL